MNGSISITKSLACANTLGEGVLWDARTQSVLWTDVEESRLYMSAYPFDAYVAVDAPERIGSFALLESDAQRIIAAFETGFGAFSLETGAVDWISRPGLAAGVRMNDGRVDRNGVFYAGAMNEKISEQPSTEAALYRLDPQHGAVCVFGGVKISNGLAWSPDGAVMYFADSPRRTIWAFDYRDGEPQNRRVFAETPEGAYPDGACVDAEGFLWSAQWGAGRVARYAPSGAVEMSISLPAPHVTCVAFGGPDLTTLFVTSAQAELSPAALKAAPQSGDLFILETDVKGLPEPRARY